MVHFQRTTLSPSVATPLLCYTLLLMCSLRNFIVLADGGAPNQSPSQPASEHMYIHYGILLDAGSSSTKSKIYRWTPPASPDTVPDVQLINTSPYKYKPALTAFRNNKSGLTDYLMHILSAIKQRIPEDVHSSTPISIMATAGLRFMSGPAVQSLLQLTRSVMSNTSINPFQFSGSSGVSVLSGEEEGVYSWIAANYLRGFFDASKDVTETVGVLEMGGGSTQITFVPQGPLYAEEFHVIVAGKKYNLYVQSYLQFGINGIKEKVARHLHMKFPDSQTVNNPCMLRNDVSVATFVENKYNLTMDGTGDPVECEEILTQVLKPSTGNKCQPKPCAIGSVYQPQLPNITFYATQAFTYAPKNLKTVGTDTILDIDRLKRAAFHHCNRTLLEAFTDSGFDQNFASDDCVTALYMTVLLTTSYGFPKDTKDIKVTSMIEGQFIDWALGAMLMEISSKGNKTLYSVACKADTVKHENISTSSFSASSSFLTFCNIVYSFLLIKNAMH